MSIIRKSIALSFTAIIYITAAFSQATDTLSKPITEIFADYHFSPGSSGSTPAFSFKRAYLGYDHYFDNRFHGTIIMNLAKQEDTINNVNNGNYVCLREASIGYTDRKLSIKFGLTSTKLMGFQQDFNDKRYVANNFQGLNGYGYLADIGLMVQYKFSRFIEADATLMNGEGATNFNIDSSPKISAGLVIYPVKGSLVRLYADATKKEGLWQNTCVAFAGFTYDIIKVGAEIDYKSNLDLHEGHHAWGFSSTASLSLNKKLQLFGRYDYSGSVIPGGEAVEWNFRNDGQLVVLGMQHTFNSAVRIALDYQAKIPDDVSKMMTDMVYLHAHFRF